MCRVIALTSKKTSKILAPMLLVRNPSPGARPAVLGVTEAVLE
jgi:hypothetical protein